MRCGLPPLIFYEPWTSTARHPAVSESVNSGEVLLVVVLSEMCCKNYGKTFQVR